MEPSFTGSINQVDGPVLDKSTDISIFLGGRRKVLAYRWLVGERMKMLCGSSHMMLCFIFMQIVERARCYRTLESCEGLKKTTKKKKHKSI